MVLNVRTLREKNELMNTQWKESKFWNINNIRDYTLSQLNVMTFYTHQEKNRGKF